MKQKNNYLPALVLIFLVSCNNQEFVKTKSVDAKELHPFQDSTLNYSNPMKIRSFNLTYNPKKNGYIKLQLENGDTYEAKSIDGGSFSSINSLLKEQDVLFDTIRKEVVLAKEF